MIERSKISFHELSIENKISLIINGLSDTTTAVKDLCKEYLAKEICAKHG